MRRPLAAVSADTHLRPGAWAGRPGIAGDSYHSFGQIFEYALAEGVPVVLAGDVFDVNTPDAYSVHVAGRHIDRLHRQCGCGTFFVEGQHEMARAPWLGLFEGARHIHERCVNFAGGPVLYGLNFTRGEQLKAALDKVPAHADVLVCHQVWAEHMGDVTHPEGRLADVPHVGAVITGDFHGHRLTEVGDAGRPLVAASPGSTCLQEINEDERKFFFVLYDDLTFASVELQTRPVIRRRVGTEDGLAALVAEAPDLVAEASAGLPEVIARPIVHVEYVRGVSGVQTRLEKALAHRAHVITRSVDVAAEEAEPTPTFRTGGLAAHLDLAVEPDTAVYHACRRLLGAAEPKAEAEAIVAEVMTREGRL